MFDTTTFNITHCQINYLSQFMITNRRPWMFNEMRTPQCYLVAGENSSNKGCVADAPITIPVQGSGIAQC